MDLDLNLRGAKLKREQDKRREQAKRRLQTEQLKRAAAAKAKAELEAHQARQRQELLEEQALREAKLLEEQRLTGGIKYSQQLRPVPTAGDGDKITLPVSALEELNPQNALDLGVFTFKLSFTDAVGAERTTHAGVLEFVAADGTVGLPPKVAASLFRQNASNVPETINVRFVRLDKGKFAKLQPRGQGFGDRDIDMKKLLERALQTHTTLTQGDVVLVRHGKETFEVTVVELQPEPKVNILNTDLEVVLVPSEAVAAEMAKAERAKAAAAQAEALAAEKEQRRQKLMQELQPEPAEDERMQVKIQLRMPDGSQATRRFAHESPLQLVFDYVAALTGDDASGFQIAATFPRRVFGFDQREQSFKELGLNGRQERLMIEAVASAAQPMDVDEENADATPNDTSTKIELAGEWGDARRTLEASLDKALYSTETVPVHALEPVIPVVQSQDQATNWEAQLNELAAMGFVDRALNIQILERYQGRLLRVVNYLSELGSPSVSDQQPAPAPISMED